MTTKQARFTIRNRHFMMLDLLVIGGAAWLSFVLRLDALPFDPTLLQGIGLYLALSLPIHWFVFLLTGLYRQHWHSAGVNELIVVALAALVSGALCTLSVSVLSILWPHSRELLPLSIPLIDALIIALCLLGTRFSLRGYYHYQSRTRHAQRAQSTNERTLTLIIGAGQTGIQVFEVLQQAADGLSVVGFLDDNPGMAGAYVRGVPVLGRLSQLRTIVAEHAVEFVVIAIPSAPGKLIRSIATDCDALGVKYKIVPGLYELVNGRISVDLLRPISIDDLLRRDQVALDTRDVTQFLAGRCVLITGAGGSIGAELVRQIARIGPSRLLLVGHGENSLFSIEAELRREFPTVAYQTILGDVRDQNRMAIIFEQYQPAVVFHAAAHKHVPMLESNPVEAITNNVLSARNLIALCNRFNVERMVLISTDKAVNPTSIMGMTKRVSELLIVQAAAQHPTRFAAVRFGNVLGSRGSVVPTFQQQIARGGPLTITSDQVTRYFMSIPEAVLLVLKAAVLADCGSLFVLNMGSPIRILDLAHDLIRLSGLVPGRDIDINIVGLRPGEKLYEELFWAHERYRAVEGGRIFAIEPTVGTPALSQINQQVDDLLSAAREYDEGRAMDLLRTVVFDSVPVPEH